MSDQNDCGLAGRLGQEGTMVQKWTQRPFPGIDIPLAEIGDLAATMLVPGYRIVKNLVGIENGVVPHGFPVKTDIAFHALIWTPALVGAYATLAYSLLR